MTLTHIDHDTNNRNDARSSNDTVINGDAFVAALRELQHALRSDDLNVPLPPGVDRVDEDADTARTQDLAYAVLGQNGFGDLPAQAAQSRDGELLAQSRDMLEQIIDGVSQEDICSWLVRLILPLVQEDEDDEDDEDNEDIERKESGLDDAQCERLFVDSCLLAGHVFLHWTQCDVFTNRVAYLFLVGEYGEAFDLILPLTQISVDIDSFSRAAHEIHDSNTTADATSAAEGNTGIESAASDVQTVDKHDHIQRDGDRLTVTGNAVPTASPVTRQYSFDVDAIHQACEGILEDGDTDAEALFSDRAFLAKFDQIIAQVQSLSGSTLITAGVEQAFYQADRQLLTDELAVLDTYCGIVEEEGLYQLPIFVIQAVISEQGDETDWQSVNDSLAQLRDASADMAAVILARVADSQLARELACALLVFDLDRYADMSSGLR